MGTSTCLLPAHRDWELCPDYDTRDWVEGANCGDQIPLKFFMKGKKLFAESGTPACENGAGRVR